MNRPQTILSITFFFSICLMFVSATFAQTDPRYKIEPNHEAVLHVIIGSGEAAQDAGLPQTFQNSSGQTSLLPATNSLTLTSDELQIREISIIRASPIFTLRNR